MVCPTRRFGICNCDGVAGRAVGDLQITTHTG
jgi:hypothetical protein